MNFDKADAAAIVREAHAAALTGMGIEQNWVAKIEHLSRLCEVGQARTHIAFIGTEILAKSLDSTVDLYAIKPTHAVGNVNAYSARTLCHSVLVPLSAELGFSIGVTGREPLNNQPYFRMTRLDDETPVHASSIESFKYMRELVDELQAMTSTGAAIRALSAFIAVRMSYQRRYPVSTAVLAIQPETLGAAITTFVKQDSEQGRRAQAVVAGLMDAAVGFERVESGRIHDPSRKSPGDVCIRSRAKADEWEKAFEVRDKPVSLSDVRVFGKKCADMGVRAAVVVMASDSQPTLSQGDLNAWASQFGISVTLFYGWDSLVEQSLFWSSDSKHEAATKAVQFIEERLIAIECSDDGLHAWHQLTRGTS